MKQASKNEGLKFAAITLGILSACLAGICLCAATFILAITVTNNFFPKDRVFDAETDVAIIWSLEDSNMFPESWLEAPTSVHVIALDPDEIDRSIWIIKSALRDYPPGLIKKTLTRVYLVNSMKHYGASIGGTYTNDTVYVVNGGIASGYSDHFIERAFHEEYSSILLRAYQSDFNTYGWEKINPPSFRYYGSGYDAIREGHAALDYDPDLLSDGFINEYAASEIENDFNAIASRLISGEGEFWQAFDEYPRIRDKALLVIDFYQKIDPMLTEEYFRSLTSDAQ